MSARRSGPGTDIAERKLSALSGPLPLGQSRRAQLERTRPSPRGWILRPAVLARQGPNASTFRWWREGARRPGAAGPSGGLRLSTRPVSTESRCVRQRSMTATDRTPACESTAGPIAVSDEQGPANIARRTRLRTSVLATPGGPPSTIVLARVCPDLDTDVSPIVRQQSRAAAAQSPASLPQRMECAVQWVEGAATVIVRGARVREAVRC